jgi:hypothetical protein
MNPVVGLVGIAIGQLALEVAELVEHVAPV